MIKIIKNHIRNFSLDIQSLDIRHSRAFTLIEVIIAISVIGLVITAAYGLTQSSLKIGRTTMNQFVAFHLAEEGLEVVRNMRDSNWLQNKSWRTNLRDGRYALRKAIGTRYPWQLEVDGGNGEGEQTIELATESDGALHVKSTTKYLERGGQKAISLEAELTDWKRGPL